MRRQAGNERGFTRFTIMQKPGGKARKQPDSRPPLLCGISYSRKKKTMTAMMTAWVFHGPVKAAGSLHGAVHTPALSSFSAMARRISSVISRSLLPAVCTSGQKQTVTRYRWPVARSLACGSFWEWGNTL